MDRWPEAELFPEALGEFREAERRTPRGFGERHFISKKEEMNYRLHTLLRAGTIPYISAQLHWATRSKAL